MKKLVLLFAFLISSLITFSQIHNPVTWSTSVEKVNDAEYNLIIKASIEPKWHLYSQNVPEDGPIPTSFTFEQSEAYELVGKVSEEEGHTVDDPVFNMKIKYFENNATFKQRIKVKSETAFKILGEVEFMVCDDTSCLPPTYVDLPFELPGAANVTNIEKTETKEVKNEENKTTHNNVVAKENKEETKAVVKNKKEEKKSLIGIFILAFFAGFAALLTPCVFPMIPMTVSFFTKQSKDKAKGIRNAIFYGISIIVIYVLLGSVVTAVFGADAMNALSTNVWFNLAFFLLLLIFGISFLGAFEITLPSSWGTKVDAQADKGGLIGIFFMALALAIVSFSCTGPIVGWLLVEAAVSGSQIGPIVGMFGFALALAIPFALFAAFPGWLNSMPKSGGWLNSVKVVLGFIEIAFAFKFLSNADLVVQFHGLEREVFIAIWIAISGTLTLYLFGKIQLPHDSPLTHISVGRLSLGLVTLAFTFYMIPGLWGAPLKLISAFPPPQHYSESPYGVGFMKAGGATSTESHETLPEGAHLLPPHNIVAFKDYDKGLAYAKKVGKPVMIDFTGWACVNCRKMEENVWVDPNVMDVLKNEVVLISLYVDQKTKLPDAPENISKVLRPGKKFKHVGQKWAELQVTRYNANAQPFYVLMDHNEENLNNPVGYTPNIDEFYNWLKDGIGKFKK